MFLARGCPGCGVSGRFAGRGSALGFCDGCLREVQTVGPITGLGGADAAAALYRYHGPVKRAVLAAKNRGRRDLLRQLGPLLADLPSGGRPPHAVTWIPAGRRGKRARGYDQGRLLARATGAALGVPAVRLLARIGGGSQTGLDRVSRLAGPALRARGDVPARVLVVDDVITTGASADAAVAALRRAGARSVVVVAVAWTASRAEVVAGRVAG